MRAFRLVVGLVTLLLTLGVTQAGAEEGTVDYPMRVIACLDDACTDREYVVGATVTATDNATGEVIDTCDTTGDATNAGCTLTVPADASTYSLSAEAGLDPDAYLPGTDYGEDGVYFFVYEAAPSTTTRDVVAVVYTCETVDCTDADGVKDPLAGAMVTSFAADGTELDSCTTGESYAGGCDLTIPVEEDGSYEVTAPEGYESYTLLSSTPEVTGEGGDGREWTFVPTGAEATETPESAAPTAVADDTVTSLPETGSGSASIPDATTWLLSAAIATVLAVLVARRAGAGGRTR